MDIAFELLSQIIRYKNGAVTDSMTERGIVYKVNYGVALHTIKSIAQAYAPNHELAAQLFARDEREAKLAAFFVEDPEEVTTEQIEEWSTQLTNIELAEQVAVQLLSKTPHAYNYSKRWIQASNLYLQKAGWTLALRTAQGKKASDEQLLSYLPLIAHAIISSPIIQQAAVQVAVRIANQSELLYMEVVSLTDKMAEGDKVSRQMASEIRAFLGS